MTEALWQLTIARLRAIYREPSTIFWAFCFPPIVLLALGVAFRNKPPDPVLAAVESANAGDAEALRLRDALAASRDVRVSLLDPPAAHEALRTGKVAIVVVPGQPRQYRFDPTRPESRLARAIVDDLLQRADGRVDPTRVREARITEPGSRYIDFLVPGLIGVNLMASGLWGIGFVLVDMRCRKLIKRLIATPMRKTDFLFSFALMRGLVLTAELPVMLGFAWLLFDVGVRGSLLLLFAMSALGSFSFAGLGLLTASRATNTETANGLINLVQMPMLMCSGVFFPSEQFPVWMHPLIKLMPLTALNDGLRAIMVDGAGPLAIARYVLIVAAWGVISFALALKLFRWR